MYVKILNWEKGFCGLGLKINSVVMAEPEIPSCGRKRESNDSSYAESEDAIKYDSDDSEESDYPVEDDSDDPTYETLEGQGDRKIWKQYYREWNESEGFDVSVHPGTSFMAGLCQMDHYLKHPESKQEYTELCKLAIEDFNSKNDKMYVLEEIVNLNATFAAGEWLYFTFTARDTIVDAASDDDAIKTFQAMVWSGIDKTVEVSFCRLKKFISNEEKKKNKKKKKKKSQLDGKAVTEVEQDKPSLVKSFVPGLVIEELAKGKPGGKKAYAGYKVGVRYTGKLKESDKIFGTNIGKGDPREFRIASSKLIKGLQFGVLGMRVGDKRRITIPPDLGYGDKGDGVVVPPNSWLVVEVELVYVATGESSYT